MLVENPFVLIRHIPAKERVEKFMRTVTPDEPIELAERRIAEEKFRQPIMILPLSMRIGVGINPFWRKGKVAPDLPIVTRNRDRAWH